MRWFLFVMLLLAQGASAYDPYKAELVRVVDGDSLADALLATGHARVYDGGKRKPWCR
jgi:endonuclease YncB( thermonuclease family)